MRTNPHRACRRGWACPTSTRRRCGCCCWHTVQACCWCTRTTGSAALRHSVAARRDSRQQGPSRLMWRRGSSAGPAALTASSAPRPRAAVEGHPGPLRRQRHLNQPGSTPHCKSRPRSPCWGQGLARQQARNQMAAPQACGSPSAWRRRRSGSGTTAYATGSSDSSWTRCWSAWWRCVSGGGGQQGGMEDVCLGCAVCQAVCLHWCG